MRSDFDAPPCRKRKTEDPNEKKGMKKGLIMRHSRLDCTCGAIFYSSTTHRNWTHGRHHRGRLAHRAFSAMATSVHLYIYQKKTKRLSK
jgi:hypothetical protein